jgi:hypothetical protein
MMDDASVNKTDDISDTRSGGGKRRLKNLQMCTKKKPNVGGYD